MGRRRKKINIEDINGVEEDGEGCDDIILNQISSDETNSSYMLVNSQSNA